MPTPRHWDDRPAAGLCHRQGLPPFHLPRREGKLSGDRLWPGGGYFRADPGYRCRDQIPVLKTVVSVSIGGKKVLVESFVDISEQKRSEAAIREANRKLNLLNSITRHDVANQLTIIQGYTQLAALRKPEPVIADFLAKIESGIETIQRQIEFTKDLPGTGRACTIMVRNR